MLYCTDALQFLTVRVTLNVFENRHRVRDTHTRRNCVVSERMSWSAWRACLKPIYFFAVVRAGSKPVAVQ